MQIVILNVTVQVEICIYCVFRMKKIIYSVLSPSPKRRIFMGLESIYSARIVTLKLCREKGECYLWIIRQ